MIVDLTEEEVGELLDTLGDPEDHYGDPGHPARSAKRKLQALGEQRRTSDRADSLLDRDWSEAWDALPEAPALVPRESGLAAWARLAMALTPTELDFMIAGMDRLQRGDPRSDAGRALERALNVEEGRRVRAGLPVEYEAHQP